MKSLKSKFAIAILAITVVSLSFFSCQKQTKVIETKNNPSIHNPQNYASMTSTQITILSEDEINSIGVMHNKLLDKILTDFDYSTLTNTNMFALARTAFINTDYKNSTTDFKTQTFDQTYAWLNEGVITGNVLNYMNLIQTELESGKHFTEVSDYLNSIKQTVSNNSDLTDLEKQTIKIGISVARNSAEYWFPIEYGGNGKGHAHMNRLSQHFGQGDITPMKAISKGGKIAGADLAGACVGGIEWCGTAIFGGPVGVGAFIGGCLYSAVAGSLLSWAGIG